MLNCNNEHVTFIVSDYRETVCLNNEHDVFIVRLLTLHQSFSAQTFLLTL